MSFMTWEHVLYISCLIDCHEFKATCLRRQLHDVQSMETGRESSCYLSWKNFPLAMSHVTDVRNEKTSVSISFPTALIFFTRSTWLWLQPSSSLWLSWLGFLEWIFKKMEGKFIPHVSGNHVCQLYNGNFESEVWSRILLGSLLRCYALEFLLFRLFWLAHLEGIFWHP